jgi:hypothetical protein
MMRRLELIDLHEKFNLTYLFIALIWCDYVPIRTTLSESSHTLITNNF